MYVSFHHSSIKARPAVYKYQLLDLIIIISFTYHCFAFFSAPILFHFSQRQITPLPVYFGIKCFQKESFMQLLTAQQEVWCGLKFGIPQEHPLAWVPETNSCFAC